jgi:ssDNA-binding Zn-finger/Zn-ribbon topoisomerase 1
MTPRYWVKCDCGYVWILSEKRKRTLCLYHVCPGCTRQVPASKVRKGRAPYSVQCPKCDYLWIPRPATQGRPSRCPKCFGRIYVKKARLR